VVRYAAQGIALMMIPGGQPVLFDHPMGKAVAFGKMLWSWVYYASAQTAIFQLHPLVSHTMP
jgi:hypothetical protein